MRSSKTKMSALAIVGGVLLAGAVNDGLGQWPPVVSDPVPLNTNATLDSGEDSYPHLTTDGLASWVAVWGSDDDFAGTIGTYANILFARSINNGATWGNRRQPLCSPPSNLRYQVPPRVSASPNSPSEAGNGSIVGWGDNSYGQCDVPPPNTDFVAVAAGYKHSLGLKADASIVAWGAGQAGQSGIPHFGQCDVPAPNTDFVAVAAGFTHSLGLKAGGSIVAWGRNYEGQCNVPAPNTDFVAVAGGRYHSLGLKAGGSIVAWGRNYEG